MRPRTEGQVGLPDTCNIRGGASGTFMVYSFSLPIFSFFLFIFRKIATPGRCYAAIAIGRFHVDGSVARGAEHGGPILRFVRDRTPTSIPTKHLAAQ